MTTFFNDTYDDAPHLTGYGAFQFFIGGEEYGAKILGFELQSNKVEIDSSNFYIAKGLNKHDSE